MRSPRRADARQAVLELWAFVAWLALTSGCPDRPFVCTSSAQCLYQGQQGTCEADRHCSFPDSDCLPSKRRYADYGTGGQCVGAGCGGASEACCAGDTCQAGLSCQQGKCTCSLAQLTAGDGHTCATLGDGHVLCWGLNGSGQLGDGTTTGRAEPRAVNGLTNASTVAAGDAHTCAVTGDTVSCWGSNARGQLGDGTNKDQLQPTPVFRLSGVTQVVTGARHSCARRKDGTVLCWGDNSKGQLGDGSIISRAVPDRVAAIGGVDELAAGDDHTCARLRDRTVWCWGTNGARHEIDPKDTQPVLTPRAIVGVTDATALAAGTSHTCALRGDGSVVCWGGNGSGQLGRALTASGWGAPAAVAKVAAAQAIDVGDSFSCALVAGGKVSCWGSNSSGQLGLEPGDPSVNPVELPLTGVVSLAIGGRHGCARLMNGGVTCWGERSKGQLADEFPVNVLRPLRVPIGNVLDVRAGQAHTCARVRPATMACWGESAFGRLGDRDVRPRPAPGPVPGVDGVLQMALANEHTCARLSDGRVLCWGRGDGGQLGDGLVKSETAPTQVPLPEKAADLAAGASHTCAAGASGKVYCWGANRSGQCAWPMLTESPPRPVEVPDLADAVQLALGANHSCARKTDGHVVCWGANDSGQLGSGPTSTGARATPTLIEELADVVDLVSGANHLCARQASGAVLCWGSSSGGQLGSGAQTARNPKPAPVIDLPGPATSLIAGGAFSCAETGKGIYCWGLNRSGELGDGSVTQRLTPVAVVGLPGDVVGLGAGESHACAVTEGGELWCWGRNQTGELGTGAPLVRPTPMPAKVGCR